MSGTGVDSMFFSDVSTLAEEVDAALVCLKSSGVDTSAVEALSRRFLGLGEGEADSLALNWLLTLADRESRGVAYWLKFGEHLKGVVSDDTIAILEVLAQSLEREQSRLEERLRTIG